MIKPYPAALSDALQNEAKLSQRIARLLEKEVLGRGWEVGATIGSETDLAERFGVSRSVIREAVSITEQDGLIVSYRGRQGGLRIAAPALEAVVKSVRNYLHYASADIESILSTRQILENLMIDVVGRNFSDADYASIVLPIKSAGHEPPLKTQLDLLKRLLTASRNPALAVFFTSLIDLILMKIFSRDIPMETFRAFNETTSALRIDYVDAMYGMDRNVAHHLAHKLNDEVRRLVESGVERDPLDDGYPIRIAIEMMASPAELPLPFKSAELLTHKIHREIIRRGWPIGASLGTEPELQKQFGVGRTVLREAIRPLERIGIVQMRQRVGLVIQRPDPSATIRSVVLYLDHEGLTRENTYVVQNELDVSGAGDIACLPEAVRLECANHLRKIVESLHPGNVDEAKSTVQAFYRGFIECLPNPVIAFFLRILGDLRSHSKNALFASDELVWAWLEIRLAMVDLIDRMESGNKAEARRAMVRFKAKLHVLIPLEPVLP